jgi:hypothetical protein
VLRIARKFFPVTEEDVGPFFWPAGSDTTYWSAFRRSFAYDIRPVDEIALAELSALARERWLKGLDRPDAITAMAREMGLQQLRPVSRARLEWAWQKGVNLNLQAYRQ